MEIRKLIKISLNIVREYGIFHLIRVVLLEYKTNKFSILKIEFDEKRIPSKYTKKTYQSWLKNEQITNKNLSILLKEPKFGIILYDEKNFQNVNKTVKSIQKQNYRNYEVIFNFPKEYEKKILKIKNIKKVSKVLYNRPIPEIANSHNIDYILFLKTGDELVNDALYIIANFVINNTEAEIIYTDEDMKDRLNRRVNPFFKPDWSPELFLSMDYISNFFVLKPQVLARIWDVNEEFLGSKYYDLLLRLTENNQKISHIPKIIVSRNKQDTRKDYEFIHKILENTVKRRKLNAVVEKLDNNNSNYRNPLRIKYLLKQKPKVSIIIPTKDQPKLLKRCINNIEKYSTSYRNYEIIIIDNNNKNPESLEILKTTIHKVVKTTSNVFNFAKINNEATKGIDGKYILFLNDDTAPLENNWLEELVGQAEQENIGVVGPKLVFNNGTVQHAGMIITEKGAGFHPFMRIPGDAGGYCDFANVVRNYSAVTGACLLIKRKIFEQVGKFDEKFDVYYNDTDLCMKVTNQGYRIVYTPFTKMLHEGSSSIKTHSAAFFTVENLCRFKTKWPQIKKGDPFYNPNFGWDFHIKGEDWYGK